MSDTVIKAIAESAGDIALACVIAVKGSSPRHGGTMMAIRADGSSAGTIGGGKIEGEAIPAARACIAAGGSKLMRFQMAGRETLGDEMICGGEALVSIEVVRDPTPYRLSLERLDKGERVLLVSRPGAGLVAVLDEECRPVHGAALPGDAAKAIHSIGSGTAVYDEAGGLFYNPLLPGEKLLVLGGGHVGRALARLAAELSFRVTVADARPEFLSADRFPPGVETRCGELPRIIDEFPFDRSTYAVIVTPGHLSDVECLRAVMGRPYRYAGFIGSRRKTRMVVEQLAAEGFDARKVKELHAPIGLAIGAETPEEIAVSIVAELVSVRRNRPAS